ncbi:MAG: branched-chain amino acid ABC transporter permease [Thermomicrobiales bacterium]|nr:branched-chain amino acid ABC transporter permease [Thermomicrobiales bacterium]
MTLFLQQIINGLTIGSVYSLVAVGYTLVYGVLRLMNFAHGSIYTLGAYFAYTALVIIKLPFALAFVFSLVATALIGILIERVGYYPLRNAPMENQIISVFGLAIVLDNAIMLLWGPSPKGFPASDLTRTIHFGAFSVSLIQLAIFAVALAIMIFLYVLVYRTKLGLAMRAAALNTEAAHLMGIDINRLRLQTFILSAMLAAVAGTMIGEYYKVITFNMGLGVVIKAFVVAILGGIGNVPGAMLGGLVLGLVESLGGAYISTGYKDAFVYIVMIAVLLFRPNGLLGRYVAEKV